jgi:hypothetical protein
MPYYDTYGDEMTYYDDDRFDNNEPAPSKEYEKRIRYMAWCFDMHALLSRLLDWIWKRIE